MGEAGKGPDGAPVVVTVAMDAASQARFDGLRRAWFPPERNHLAAHVTLFHALPGERLPQLLADAADVVRRPAFSIAVTGLRFLGRGVAYDMASEELHAVRRELVRRWRPLLSRQDGQPFRPHVTVQNKVAPQVARATLATLASQPLPPATTGEGLAFWRYRGGPWEPVTTLRFDPAE